MYPHRQLRPHQRRQILQRRLGDLRHGAIVQQQPLLGLLTHTFDLAEGALNGGLGAEIAVEGNAEAVRLVPDALLDLQGL